MSKPKTWKENSKKFTSKNVNFHNAGNPYRKKTINPIIKQKTVSPFTMHFGPKDPFQDGSKGFMITLRKDYHKNLKTLSSLPLIRKVKLLQVAWSEKSKIDWSGSERSWRSGSTKWSLKRLKKLESNLILRTIILSLLIPISQSCFTDCTNKLSIPTEKSSNKLKGSNSAFNHR